MGINSVGLKVRRMNVRLQSLFTVYKRQEHHIVSAITSLYRNKSTIRAMVPTAYHISVTLEYFRMEAMIPLCAGK